MCPCLALPSKVPPIQQGPPSGGVPNKKPSVHQHTGRGQGRSSARSVYKPVMCCKILSFVSRPHGCGRSLFFFASFFLLLHIFYIFFNCTIEKIIFLINFVLIYFIKPKNLSYYFSNIKSLAYMQKFLMQNFCNRSQVLKIICF